MSYLEQQTRGCYTYQCNNKTGIVIEKSLQAIEIENKTNECFAYQCDNETGLATYSMCKYYKDPVCVDDECIESKTLDEKDVVIIDVDNNNCCEQSSGC